MSLINSMLRDLEARRGDNATAAPFQGQIRAVPPGPAPGIKVRLGAAAGGVLLLAMAAVAGQRLWQAPAPQATATVSGTTTPAAVAAPAAAAMTQEEPAIVEPAPNSNARLARTDDVNDATANAMPAAAGSPAPVPAKSSAPSASTVPPVPPAPASAVTTSGSTPGTAGASSQPPALSSMPQAMQASARPQPGNEEMPLQPAPAPAPVIPAAQPLMAARETAPQPDMTMQLARRQLQDNGLREAIETLQRGLPQAAGRADYHAFLAALLQRDNQHRAAAGHYAAALRSAPDNGVWWMGLGISYQALQMAPQAQQAYLSAQASRTLSPDLAAFVDARLDQLQRP